MREPNYELISDNKITKLLQQPLHLQLHYISIKNKAYLQHFNHVQETSDRTIWTRAENISIQISLTLRLVSLKSVIKLIQQV